MNELDNLLAEYDKDIKDIHENRKAIRDLLKENQASRDHLSSVKAKMQDIIANEVESGKTLYKICMDNFGVIDKRFHVLFSLFGKNS